MARWKSLEGQNRERQEIISQPSGFSFDSAAIAGLRAKVTDGLHLAQAQGQQPDRRAGSRLLRSPCPYDALVACLPY